MINEEIVGGLVSALSRKQSLESAMMTFYNAGYKKDEIEDSAKEVYNQLGPQSMGVNGSLQETLNEIAIKAGVPVTPKEQATEKPVEQSKDNTPENISLQTPSDKKPSEVNTATKEEDRAKQNISNYGQDNYQSTADITNKIQEAIKGLRPVNIPSKIEIVHRNVDAKGPTVIQRVSDYYSESPKPVSKSLTYILIAILIILLLMLGAVFLFKNDLIKLFNDLGLG
jgi:hypothetical protein